MKFFIINTDYQDFIDKKYRQNPEIKNRSFSEQLEHRYNTFFGVSNFYSKNLKLIGHEAIDIISNDSIMQGRWASENKLGHLKLLLDLFELPLIKKIPRIKRKILELILVKQIEKYNPDVVYNMAMESVDSAFLSKVKNNGEIFIVGQHAAPITKSMSNLDAYDLIFSSLPNYVENFKKKGLNAEYLKLAFEESILEKTQDVTDKIYDVIYVGSFSQNHSSRIKTLEHLAEQKEFKIDFWGYDTKELSPTSPIINNFHGFIGGLDMYKVIKQAKICINGHINISEQYANNMRLYETTGMGTLLITDQKVNIDQIFNVDEEILTYSSKEDLTEKIVAILKQDDKLKRVSEAGQKRTLTEHTYRKRMEEMVNLINLHKKNVTS